MASAPITQLGTLDPNVTDTEDCVTETNFSSVLVILPFLMMVNPVPAVTDVRELLEPTKPSIISLVLLVLTPVTVGIDDTVELANFGTETFVSHGVTKFAPLTPNATTSISRVVAENVATIEEEVKGDAAEPYHTSIF